MPAPGPAHRSTPGSGGSAKNAIERERSLAVDSAALAAAMGQGRRSPVAGRYEESGATLLTTVAVLRKLGAQGESNLAQALESEGDAALQQTVVHREKSPTDIWELAQARERPCEALFKQNNSGAIDLLKHAALDLEAQLGADNPLMLRAKAAVIHKKT